LLVFCVWRTHGSTKQAENIEIELAAELLRSDLLNGAEAIDAGIVDEDLELTVLLLDLREGASDVLSIAVAFPAPI
jgi:hypothetical protein